MTTRTILPFIVVVLTIMGCSIPNSLMVTNTYPHPATLVFDFEGTKDSAEVLQRTVTPVLSDAIATSSRSDEYRLRTITVKQSNGAEHIYRFSNTYLESQHWSITLPFFAQDTIPPRSLDAKKYSLLVKDNTLYHIAQEYYNSGEFVKCFYLLDGYFRSGASYLSAFRANFAEKQITYEIERERFIGISVLMYLSKKKGNRPESKEDDLKELQRLAPDYAKYLLKNDPEFAP